MECGQGVFHKRQAPLLPPALGPPPIVILIGCVVLQTLLLVRLKVTQLLIKDMSCYYIRSVNLSIAHKSNSTKVPHLTH